MLCARSARRAGNLMEVGDAEDGWLEQIACSSQLALESARYVVYRVAFRVR